MALWSAGNWGAPDGFRIRLCLCACSSCSRFVSEGRTPYGISWLDWLRSPYDSGERALGQQNLEVLDYHQRVLSRFASRIWAIVRIVALVEIGR